MNVTIFYIWKQLLQPASIPTGKILLKSLSPVITEEHFETHCPRGWDHQLGESPPKKGKVCHDLHR